MIVYFNIFALSYVSIPLLGSVSTSFLHHIGAFVSYCDIAVCQSVLCFGSVVQCCDEREVIQIHFTIVPL